MSSIEATGRSHVATEQAFELFCQSRACAGLRGALACLGELSGYRCVALIRLDGERPTAIAYVDRDDPEAGAPEVWPRAVIDACLLRDGEGRVREAGELLSRPPADCEDVNCRCVPVMGREGELHASLCLFNHGPVPPAATDLSLLLQVAASLADDDTAGHWPSDAADASDAPWQSAAGEEDPGSSLDDESAPADSRH